MKADSETRRRRDPFFEKRYERAKIVLVCPDTVFERHLDVSQYSVLNEHTMNQSSQIFIKTGTGFSLAVLLLPWA